MWRVAYVLPLYILLGLTFGVTISCCGAPPDLQGFFPAGGVPGQTVKIKVEGSFDTWPCQWWVDRPGMTIRCEEAQGEVSIRIAPEAGHGRYWVRAYHAAGASKLVPFLICGGGSVVEAEPNDHPEKAQKLGDVATVDGKLGKNEDVDCYQLELTAGARLSARVDAHRWLGSPIDMVLQICDEHGRVLKHRDDGVGLDPTIDYVASQDGIYVIRVFGFPATPNSTIGFSGGDRMVYRLTVTKGEMESPLNAAVQGRNLGPLPRSVSGEKIYEMWQSNEGNPNTAFLWLPGSTKWHALPCPAEVRFHYPSGSSPEVLYPAQAMTRVGPGEKETLRQTVQLNDEEPARVRVLAQTLGQPLDPVLRVLNAAGEIVATVDDAGGNRDAFYDWKGKADRQLVLEIQDRFDRDLKDSNFAILIEPLQPFIEVQWSQEVWTGKQGEPMELGLNVKSDQDREGEWELVLLAAPDGIRSTPVSLSSIKKAGEDVKLVVEGANAINGPLKVGLRRKDSQESVATAFVTLEGIQVDYQLAWITLE